MHRILIVGCGSIGERHARCFLKTGRAEVSICDTNHSLRRELGQKYKLLAYSELGEAFAEAQFDGVVIATPAPTHVGLALLALRQGASVLIEKPLSVSLEHIDALKEEVALKKRFVAVAYVHHVRPGMKEVRELLRDGSLGNALQICVHSGQHFPTFRPAYRNIYYARHETGGGAIQDALTHLVNTVEWLIGPATQIYCLAARQALEGVEVEDTVNLAARHGPALASYCLNQFQAPDETTAVIHCAAASLKLEFHKQRWSIWRRGQPGWEHHAVPFGHRDDLFIAQAHAFVDGMEGRANPLCTLEEGIQTLKVNLAALESARIGRPLSIG